MFAQNSVCVFGDCCCEVRNELQEVREVNEPRQAPVPDFSLSLASGGEPEHEFEQLSVLLQFLYLLHQT